MELRWLRTATVECSCAGRYILIDPFFVRGDRMQNRVLKRALARADLILITHPHLDHFSHIAKFLQLSEAPVYVSEGGRRIAAKMGLDMRRLRALRAGMEIRPAEALLIRVRESRHIRFDAYLCIKTVLRALRPRNLKRGLQLGRLNRSFRIGEGDVFGFEIVGEGRRIFVLGSANLCEEVDYPRDMDCLLYPFQGRSDIAAYSASIMKRLRPKRVLLTHYDDSFPPISSRVETGAFCRQFPFAEEAKFNRKISI